MRARLFLGAAVVFLWATAVSGQTLTVGDLIELAAKRNRDYLAAKQRVAEAQALLRQAGVRPFPTIEVSSSSGRPLGTVGEGEYSAGYFQPLETSGKRGKRIQVAEQAVRLAEAEVAQRLRQLVFEIASRFSEAQAAERKLDALRRMQQINLETHKITEARVREGDAALLEQRLVKVELDRSEAQETLGIARAQSVLLDLRKSVGLDSNEALALSPDSQAPKGLPALAELQRRAVASRSDLKIAAILAQHAEAEAGLARAEGRPDLTASVKYSRTYSQFDQLGLNRSGGVVALKDRDDVLSVGLAIPLFTRRRTEGAVEAALARKSGAQLQREYLERAIPLEVEAAYRRWDAARRSAEIGERVVQQLDQNLAVIREAYQLGQLRILDVLNETRRRLETEMTYIDTRAEQAQALAELERAVGERLQ